MILDDEGKEEGKRTRGHVRRTDVTTEDMEIEVELVVDEE